jgi:ribosomal protein S18 acetylase RimI-like enzyme
MELNLPGARLGTRREEFVLRRMGQPQAIRVLLEGERSYAAYALGQLENNYFPLSEWWFGESGHAEGLLLHSRGGLGEALFVTGDTAAIDVLLSLHPGPLRTFVTCRPDHLATVKRHFWMSGESVMMRMALDRPTFRDSERSSTARRLSGRDVRDLNRLYGSEGNATFYSPWHLDDGVYYGLFEGRRLIAAAGTHVVSPTSDIAVVGNVYTHPAWRNRGHAQAVTAAVSGELLKRCSDIVLTVDPRNRSAVAAYEKLGYRDEGRLIEAAAVRKDILALGSRVRRRLARLRSSPDGGEVVSRRVRDD